MSKNEFLPFGTTSGANVLTPTAYGQLAARGKGFTAGVAKSQELNTVWRQASVIAATVAQFIANRSGDDVLDDGNLTALQASLEKALKAKIDEEGVVRTVNTHGPDASGDVEVPMYGLGMGPVNKADAYSNIAQFYRVNATAKNKPPAVTGNVSAGIVCVPMDAAPSAGYFAVVGGNMAAYVGYSGAEAGGITWARLYTDKYKPSATDIQAADWTNNFATRMGVSRVLTEANLPTSPGVWSVENSTWAGTTWGSLLCATNGSDLSTTPGNQKFIQYLQITHEAGGKAGLRVAANINGTFSGWDQAMMTRGGTFLGQVIAPSFASTPEVVPNGAGTYADQLSSQAPFFQPNWQWEPNTGGIFVPIAKGTSTRKGQGYPTAVTYGYLMPGTNEFAHPTIHVRGDNNFECVWDFNPQSGAISSKEGTFATQEWVNTNTFNSGNHPTQASVSGNQWWYKDLSTGMIFQGGYFEGQNANAMDRIPLNISVPNRLLHVSTIIRNYAQGYETTYNPQVQDLSNERDGFNWFHGAQERIIYWMAVGY